MLSHHNLIKNKLQVIKRFVSRNPKRTIFILIVVIFITSLLFNLFPQKQNTGPDTANGGTIVETASVSALQNGEKFSIVGEIKNTDEALLTTQSAGRIERVYSSIGDTLNPGQVVLELENSSERAALNQALASLQQTYATAQSGQVSIAEAQNTLKRARENANSTILESFSTTERIIYGTVDQFFSNPEGGLIGARIGEGGIVHELNEQRTALRSSLQEWETLNTGNENEIILSNLEQATTHSQVTLELVGTILEALQSEDAGGAYTTSEIITLRTKVAQEREQMLGLQEKMRTARNSLESAIQALEKANLQSNPDTNSVSQASIAQAQANVQSARSRLNKTIIVSPVRGTLTDFSVTVGQFVNAGTQVGKVNAPGSLYVQAFINEKEKNLLQVGQEVQVGQQATGTLTYLSPNVNSTNGKYEVRVALVGEQFSSGSSATVTFASADNRNEADRSLFLPVTAIQFNGNEAQILSVDQDNRTYSISVELGETKGNNIEIITPLEPELEIIIDARGIKLDEIVELEK